MRWICYSVYHSNLQHLFLLHFQNVLLSGDLPCQAKICDFGLAKVRQESATMTGNIGTVSWTAPEVLNNIRYHFAADIYSFGMTLVEMVSGECRLPMNTTCTHAGITVCPVHTYVQRNSVVRHLYNPTSL